MNNTMYKYIYIASLYYGDIKLGQTFTEVLFYPSVP